MEEAAALKDETEVISSDPHVTNEFPPHATHEVREDDEPDPFGLDALIPNAPKDKKLKGKTNTLIDGGRDDKSEKVFLKSQRESLISCLEIAAKRYKTPWLVFPSRTSANYHAAV